MSHLLYCIVERDRPTSGQYDLRVGHLLSQNDAGTGFYKLAQEDGILPQNASSDQKLMFWTSRSFTIFTGARIADDRRLSSGHPQPVVDREGESPSVAWSAGTDAI